MEATFLSEGHSEKMLGFKKEQQGLQTQYGLKSQQNLNGSETHPTLCIHFSKTVRIFFFAASLSPAADSYLTQFITTVGIESYRPQITFSVKQKQTGLSLLLGVTRKMVISPSQQLTVIDTIILLVLYILNAKLQV